MPKVLWHCYEQDAINYHMQEERLRNMNAPIKHTQHTRYKYMYELCVCATISLHLQVST